MILYLETSDLSNCMRRAGFEYDLGPGAAADIVATSILSYAEPGRLSPGIPEKGIDQREYDRVKKELETDWEHILSFT